MSNPDILDIDVLIIGAGGAGLRAAIEADKKSVKAAIVSKGRFPSGCTRYAMGLMQAAYDQRDTPDIHLRDTLTAGGFINDKKLVKLMVNKASEQVLDLEEFGTDFQKENGKLRLFPSGGCTYPRGVVSADPYEGGFIKGLEKEVKKRGIEIFENVMVTRLLTETEGVNGATALNLHTGDFLTFGAKTTIVATGGAGQLYQLTTNPPDVTGDGYALAYRAGADLMDMEFVQSRACIVYPMMLRGTPPPADGLVTIGGRFYNAVCQRYMKKYDPVKIEKVTRDLIAIYTCKEIKEGRGTPHGGVYNDLSAVPEEELQRFTSFMKTCKAEGIDPRWQPVEWAPGVHHFMGGIVINERAESTIDALYACGEVTAGVHGANRIAGNALTDTQVFGAIAGEFAAKEALSRTIPKINETQIDAERKRVFDIYDREDGVDAEEARRRIQAIMERYAGVVRKGDELIIALDKLERIGKKEIPCLCILGEKTYRKLGEALEVINFVDVGKMLVRAALMRTESRGAHYREDSPERDDRNWLKNIIIRLEFGEMMLETRQAAPIDIKSK